MMTDGIAVQPLEFPSERAPLPRANGIEKRSPILANAASFEDYCAALSERLNASKTARIEFLTYAIDRLQTLKSLADMLTETDAAAAIAHQLHEARQEKNLLSQVAGDPW